MTNDSLIDETALIAAYDAMMGKPVIPKTEALNTLRMGFEAYEAAKSDEKLVEKRRWDKKLTDLLVFETENRPVEYVAGVHGFYHALKDAGFLKAPKRV